jgi:hypothetical protein
MRAWVDLSLAQVQLQPLYDYQELRLHLCQQSLEAYNLLRNATQHDGHFDSPVVAWRFGTLIRPVGDAAPHVTLYLALPCSILSLYVASTSPSPGLVAS